MSSLSPSMAQTLLTSAQAMISYAIPAAEAAMKRDIDALFASAEYKREMARLRKAKSRANIAAKSKPSTPAPAVSGMLRTAAAKVVELRAKLGGSKGQAAPVAAPFSLENLPDVPAADALVDALAGLSTGGVAPMKG